MKPDDVHLGVIDFFAIMLPGTIAVAYFDRVGGRAYAEEMLPAASFSGVGAWVLFALASYAVGHFVFLLASLLDDTYDFIRPRVWPDKPGNAFNRAKALRDRALCTEDGCQPMNTFSWAKAVLQLNSKQAAADIARLEADQKFFRSLCVVLSTTGIHGLFRDKFTIAIVLVLVGLAAYARYVERRYKTTQWAYYYVLALSSPHPRETRSADREWHVSDRGAADSE